MKFFDILRQFKSIAPDAQFAERTKRDVLAAPQRKPLTVRGIFSVLHMVETGVAVALAGLFIVILTGGLGGGNSISPIQYSVIDPAGLSAEAKAIDIQIQLADINYPQVTSTASGATSPAEASALTRAISRVLAPKSGTESAASASSTAASGASGASTSTTSTTPLSVDQALQQLSH